MMGRRQVQNSFNAAASSPKRFFLISLFAHVIILLLLFSIGDTAHPIEQHVSSPNVVQQSTVVESAQVEQEIEHIKAERAERIHREQQAVRALQHKQSKINQQLAQKRKALTAQSKRLAKLKTVQRQQLKQLNHLYQKQAAAEKAFSQQQKQLKSTQQKLAELQKQQKAATDAAKKKRLALEAKRLAEQLQAQQLAAEKSELQNRRIQEGIIDKYRARILAAIQQHWIIPKETQPGMKCQFLVKLSPEGVVQQVELVKSSGSSVLDRSARVALFKASPLPVPKDPALNASFRSIRLTVKPDHY